MLRRQTVQRHDIRNELQLQPDIVLVKDSSERIAKQLRLSIAEGTYIVSTFRNHRETVIVCTSNVDDAIFSYNHTSV